MTPGMPHHNVGRTWAEQHPFLVLGYDVIGGLPCPNVSRHRFDIPGCTWDAKGLGAFWQRGVNGTGRAGYPVSPVHGSQCRDWMGKPAQMMPTLTPNATALKISPTDLLCRPNGATRAALGRKGARFNFPGMFLDGTPSVTVAVATGVTVLSAAPHGTLQPGRHRGASGLACLCHQRE